MILVLGGTRSGKSSYAESLLMDIEGKILYIATAVPFDHEMKVRIAKHKLARPSHWDTYEGYKNIGIFLKEQGPQYAGIILECVTLMISNLLLDFSKDHNLDEIDYNLLEKSILNEIDNLIEGLMGVNGTVVLVSSEVGFGIVPESKLGRYFRDIAGKVTQHLASKSEDVYLLVAGLPLKIK
jgi:adenosylcobinamide kinase/adenosylcobinamide-phosphate guanylyltransferase